jgi:hypothetical protein
MVAALVPAAAQASPGVYVAGQQADAFSAFARTADGDLSPLS